jgi:Ca2+-binding EF-hand superfamily protein
MHDMGRDLSDAEFGNFMSEIDTDNSGELDFSEFQKWWLRQDPEAKRQLAIINEIDFDEL